MNIHPIVVHFPIGLLTLYSLLEVIRRFTKGEIWQHTRKILVITGTVSIFLSLATGEEAEHLFRNRELFNVLEVHSVAATATAWIYAILAASYLLLVLKDKTTLYANTPQFGKKLLNTILQIATTIRDGYWAPALAILGFLAMSLTGALGGILVYGPDFDPITKLIYKLLFSS